MPGPGRSPGPFLTRQPGRSQTGRNGRCRAQELDIGGGTDETRLSALEVRCREPIRSSDRSGWDGAGAPGGPPKGQSPARGAPDPGAAQRRRLMPYGQLRQHADTLHGPDQTAAKQGSEPGLFVRWSG